MPSNPLTVSIGWFLAFGCLAILTYWCLVLLYVRLANRSMPRVAAGLDVAEPNDGWPKVSVIIPAHNEEQFIGHALQTLLAGRYDAKEIIVAADRCTDRTAEIVRGIAASAAPGRVRLVEIDECPEGWSGKCHASWCGAKAAQGQWLLFADADTTFHPDLIRAAMGIAISHRLDFLSLLGQLTSARTFERTEQPVAAMSLMKMYPIHRANRNDRPGRRPFANGQFMLFRKEVYESIGTHEHIRDAILEDLRFARRLDFLQHRMGLALADELFQVRMYETVDEFHRGWKRIFIEAANRNIPRLRGHVWRLRFLAIAPLVQAGAFIVGLMMMGSDAPLAWSLIALAAASMGVQALGLARAYRMQGLSPREIWRFPIGCVRVARVFREAVADLKHDRGIEWGARVYQVKSQAE